MESVTSVCTLERTNVSYTAWDMVGRMRERDKDDNERRRGRERKNEEANQPRGTPNGQDRVGLTVQMPGKTKAGEAERPGAVRKACREKLEQGKGPAISLECRGSPST
ncbi:hypothetical protein NDU88_005589 [Pleurodeles waltl]|uniref:Uncharacterized protein n=1 Tax=Pleurodeles waltl TaxID=8319 RepID=A0AAV7MDA9_PLEWA|nr:hypothetical protein NDU88_005589 [Pleurodeles waltl]